jgi:biotin/methionine sulfoxide reductase
LLCRIWCAGDLRRVHGWASAGRFHDAQSQIHRFLNLAGGYVRSVGSYSSGAATVILPHILGPQGAVAGNTVSWDELVSKSALVLAFGGMAVRNNDVGAAARAGIARAQLRQARDQGSNSTWWAQCAAICRPRSRHHPIRPGTDVPPMLGLTHILVTEGRHDRAFPDRFCAAGRSSRVSPRPQ